MDISVFNNVEQQNSEGKLNTFYHQATKTTTATAN